MDMLNHTKMVKSTERRKRFLPPKVKKMYWKTL